MTDPHPPPKLTISGRTGFIGSYLKKRLEELGYRVTVISRKEGLVQWGGPEGIVEAIEGIELMINLAGKSVGCHYHERNKHETLASRTETTNKLNVRNTNKTKFSIIKH